MNVYFIPIFYLSGHDLARLRKYVQRTGAGAQEGEEDPGGEDQEVGV